MFYLYIKTLTKVEVHKLQQFADREPILQRLNINTDSYIFIGEDIYHKLELDGKTPEEQYEILARILASDLYNYKEN